MKDISPGPPCVPVENAIKGRVGHTVQVERRFLEIDVDMMEGPPDCLLPIQNCCVATIEEISRVQAESGALKCSAPQLKGEEYERASAELQDCVDLSKDLKCAALPGASPEIPYHYI